MDFASLVFLSCVAAVFAWFAPLFFIWTVKLNERLGTSFIGLNGLQTVFKVGSPLCAVLSCLALASLLFDKSDVAGDISSAVALAVLALRFRSAATQLAMEPSK
jgi:hypothetical protein